VIETPAWLAMSRIVARPFGFPAATLGFGRKLAPVIGLPKGITFSVVFPEISEVGFKRCGGSFLGDLPSLPWLHGSRAMKPAFWDLYISGKHVNLYRLDPERCLANRVTDRRESSTSQDR
jgi:hypothetical protein